MEITQEQIEKMAKEELISWIELFEKRTSDLMLEVEKYKALIEGMRDHLRSLNSTA